MSANPTPGEKSLGEIADVREVVAKKYSLFVFLLIPVFEYQLADRQLTLEGSFSPAYLAGLAVRTVAYMCILAARFGPRILAAIRALFARILALARLRSADAAPRREKRQSAG